MAHAEDVVSMDTTFVTAENCEGANHATESAAGATIATVTHPEETIETSVGETIVAGRLDGGPTTAESGGESVIGRIA